jgi:hypothetical protein
MTPAATHIYRLARELEDTGRQIAMYAEVDDPSTRLYRTRNKETECALIDALEALGDIERDAARYRFWRDRYQITFPEAKDWTPDRIDAATDAAMKEESK